MMCGCKQGTCAGNCPCGCSHTAPTPSREWKPGDVALLTTIHGWTGHAVYTNRNMWHNFDGYWGASEVANVRPLVVLDLPNGAKAGWPTLIDALDRAREKIGLDMVFGGLIEQIRAQTEPPLIEPTDPTARVTDRRDNIWRLLADGDWVCTSGPDIGEYLAWSGLVGRGPLEVQS